MADKDKRLGECLCGAIKLLVNIDNTDLGACHCMTCLKWSGGPLMELECGANVEFEGAENIRTYESSTWAVRGFCKQCGSHVFIKEKSSNSYGIPVGLFKDDSGISFNRQVFFDNKPSFYDFLNSTLNITSETIYQLFPEAKKIKE